MGHMSIQVRAHASPSHLPQENHSVQLVKNARQQATADSSGVSLFFPGGMVLRCMLNMFQF